MAGRIRKNALVRAVRITKVRGTRRVAQRDLVAVEEPLEIRVRGRSVAVTMRTPGHDRELAAGFLLTERVVRERKDLIEIATCTASREPQNTLDVFLAPGVTVDFGRLTRHVFAASSCGLCGKASVEAVTQHFPKIKSRQKISARILASLPAQMRASQAAFEITGGLHAAAYFDPDGKLQVLREDVGRHNAVDKVIGHLFLERQLTAEQGVLLVSGRASFEILQKALAARIPVICAVSAPSSLAVEFARRSGQTLVGFLRDGGMNVYAGRGLGS
ncbi:MAG TPA: formate dehydrogenase accessory sulfurtransferase FdhD [Verrucomicrobiae bacterium]